MYAYMRPKEPSSAPDEIGSESTQSPSKPPQDAGESLDRTAKMYIGGKQSRPDGNYSLPVYAADGSSMGDVGRGNRKDVRNAVEAARKAQAGWAARSAHNRAQILYYFAENLEALDVDIRDERDALDALEENYISGWDPTTEP